MAGRDDPGSPLEGINGSYYAEAVERLASARKAWSEAFLLAKMRQKGTTDAMAEAQAEVAHGREVLMAEAKVFLLKKVIEEEGV